MSKKEKVIYKIAIEHQKEYYINVRIGDGQPGDNNVFGTCPYETEPENDNPEWKSYLGTGSQIKGTILFISSVTKDTNPNTNWVSVRIQINGEELQPKEGNIKLEVEENDIAYFNQKIEFV